MSPRKRGLNWIPLQRSVFVGYSETSKAYRIYILALRSVVVRRDVKFEEGAIKRSRELDDREPSVAPQQ